MRRRVLAFALFLAPLAATAQEAPEADPYAAARVVLMAYRDRDLATLSLMANGTNRSLFVELAMQGADHPRYDSIFRGWRTEAVDGWDGALGNYRIDSRGMVQVPFAVVGNEVMTLVLEEETGGYGFEDVNSPSTADFLAMPVTP